MAANSPSASISVSPIELELSSDWTYAQVLSLVPAHANGTRNFSEASIAFVPDDIVAPTSVPPQALIIDPLDFSDFNAEVLDIVVPGLLAVAHALRKNPSAVVGTIAAEGSKMLLYVGGLGVQEGLGLGEGVDKLD
ncbi:hypothetical protein B0H12DRAFT_1151344, partial [Mycena haematopus]